MKLLLCAIFGILFLIQNCNARCAVNCAAVSCLGAEYCDIDETLIPADGKCICCSYCEKSTQN